MCLNAKDIHIHPPLSPGVQMGKVGYREVKPFLHCALADGETEKVNLAIQAVKENWMCCLVNDHIHTAYMGLLT